MARVTPPYSDGGIREWGEDKDRNDGEYRDGNHPILTIGDDDPMGWFGPHISKYESKTPEYQQALANLWWRLYALGYSFERFSEIDKEIVRLNGTRSYSKHERYTSTYGEKYRLIAAYELVGYRHDLGLLKHEYADESEYEYLHERSHLADIDPSFPEDHDSPRVTDANLLGDRNIPIEEWILHGPDPDLVPALTPDTVYERPGPWVLLDGLLSQTDEQAKRSSYVLIRALVVDAKDAHEVAHLLQAETQDRELFHEPPRNYYTFAGEIPWADTYPPNGVYSLRMRLGIRRVVETKPEVVLYKGGKRIPDMDRDLVWTTLVEQANDAADEDTGLGLIEAGLQELGLTVNIEDVPNEREEADYKTFQVSCPVREDGWEGYHSSIVPHRDMATPSREIAEHLDLWGRPQTFDLFEKDGSRASVSSRTKERHADGEKLVYLRKDLLDRYLADTECGLSLEPESITWSGMNTGTCRKAILTGKGSVTSQFIHPRQLVPVSRGNALTSRNPHLSRGHIPVTHLFALL